MGYDENGSRGECIVNKIIEVQNIKVNITSINDS